jgi:hypothetical protein
MSEVNVQTVKDPPKETLPIFEDIAKRFDTVMRCPVCDGLHNNYRLACEAEATATLQQRHGNMLGPQQEAPGRDTFQQLQGAILSSRKQQLKIASRLEQHRTLTHL